MTTAVFEARPRKARRISIAAAVLLVAVFAVVAALLRRTPTGVYFRLSDQVAMMLLGLLLAGVALLFVRPRVRAGAEGVEVRNLLGTRMVPWELVLRVSFPDGAPWARLELPDDEYIAVMAIQSADGRHAVQDIRALRAVRAEHTTPRGAPGSDHLTPGSL
ncbi:MAG: PH domain-containing protein [Pseudonocardiales bacterium]|nr:PH domain-containing protein [Pseudonocardiales bacterium]MBV9031274.1 PH domain-containing protein [Pseudonocardiales bacterium]MBW0011408.1 PH domain-containing protein [Pseudonocardiales bacterium]